MDCDSVLGTKSILLDWLVLLSSGRPKCPGPNWSKSMLSSPGKGFKCKPNISGVLSAVIGDVFEDSAHDELSWVLRSRCEGVAHFVSYSLDPLGYDVVGVDQIGLNKKSEGGTFGSLWRCFTRPALLVTRYSHLRWRVAQRSQVGFLRLHLTFEAEHA